MIADHVVLITMCFPYMFLPLACTVNATGQQQKVVRGHTVGELVLIVLLP